MSERQHQLCFRVALPMKTSDEKVFDVIHKARLHLKELAGPMSGGHQYRHIVEEKEARMGGPTGTDIRVKYVQVFCRFSGLLNDVTAGLKQEYESARLAEIVKEHTWTASETVPLVDPATHEPEGDEPDQHTAKVTLH